ncbi:UDP-2,3-diacylglucosamine diphosphatase [Paenacidovorax monticola]|uniref:UDP-2,3-diacylglucosamine hydrolase n=1 Tax=Paenacidovorax monticola TaxID=1926868 RepID=A0A7H0HFX3_9BURK|nr:UDP-2,3-diacylglucosamine diphosphatase [Paenacidovorax monticola]QNP59439.1 UDP-2,3-diacylglucosamine diphosphatase [Paenacidovorax monticola]
MTPAVPRCEELAAPSDWRTVDFISDLHLHPSEGETFAAWRRYLAATPADAVFMLGDLFEVWVGDDAAQEPGSFEAQCGAVLREAAQQRALFFLHGNRDFLVGPAFLRACGVTGLFDPTVLQFAGRRWLLSHGDALCLDDVEYQRFRTVARSSAWQQQFLAQPLPERRAQARGIREQSEARKRSGVVYADVDGPAAIAWLQATQAHALVHGHTHRPADHLLAPDLARHVLSDWDLAATPPRADVLRLTTAGLERIALAPR